MSEPTVHINPKPDSAYAQGTAVEADIDGSLIDMPPSLLRKVDLHIVPVMFLVYLMNLIDKVALNVCGSNLAKLVHS
jgi:hypothetical protein